MNFNYKRKNVDEGVVYNNIECIRTFSDIPGEAGFILTHVAIDGYSPKVVEILEKIFESIKNKSRKDSNICLKLLNE